MSSEEMLVIVAGLFFGYLIVHFLLNRKNSDDSAKFKEQYDPSSSQKKSEQDSSSKYSRDEKSTDNQDDIPTNWFRILEVAETASLAEISASYKRTIRQYHPDKVASLGKELRELAEIKSKQINSAYEFAQKLKNF